MSDCTQLNADRIKQAENDGLEGENMFIFMYETNGGDLGLENVPTNHSYIRPRMSGNNSQGSKEPHDR